MKRILAIFTAAAILLSLAGCRTEQETPSAETSCAIQQETTIQTEPPTTVQETQPPETEPPVVPPEPEDEDLVRVSDYLPDIRQELAYATEDNFTGQQIYEFSEAYLRYGTVKKLQKVCEALAEQGLFLKIWDGFRPVSAQFKLWEVCPDPTYVANPTTGYSSHSRGNTVDLTLVDRNGNEIEMPTGFDDFSSLADRDYSDCTVAAAANAKMLQDKMEQCGFSGYFGEWWHFSDQQAYPVEESFQPVSISRWYAECNEFISLRTRPDTAADVITRIPVGEEFDMLAVDGDFAYVDYQGLQGYVLRSYIRSVDAEPQLSVPTLWAANCQEYISLRETPGSSTILQKIPTGETFTLKSWHGRYARVTCGDQEGYVLTSYIKPADDTYLPSCLSIVAPTDTYSHEQLLYDIEQLKAAYPNTVTISSIGTSELGRDIPVLLLGDPNASHHVLLQGAIHGREHMTAWLLMAMADYWLGRDLEGMENVCFHLIPMSNPDGVTVSQTGQLNETQTGVYLSDKQLGYTDLDAKNYAALWKANGLGVDINRNFPAGWDYVESKDGPSSQKYRGDSPFSSAEAAALRDYTRSYPFEVTISYHASGSVIYYEYGNSTAANDASKSLANAVYAVTGYGLESSSGVDGAGYKDWAIDALGIPSLTIEIGCDAAPLAERELYSIFARNCGVLPAIAQWLA